MYRLNICDHQILYQCSGKQIIQFINIQHCRIRIRTFRHKTFGDQSDQFSAVINDRQTVEIVFLHNIECCRNLHVLCNGLRVSCHVIFYIHNIINLRDMPCEHARH